MEQKPKTEWVKDFEEFLKSSSVPSESLSRGILAEIQDRLNPSLLLILFKFSFIHLISGASTLLFCPQFGIGPFFGDHGIMGIFMHLGPIGCAMACGAFFLGSTFFWSGIFLQRDELRKVKKLEMVHITFFAAISYAVLMLMGAHNDSFEFIFWLFGAVLGGYIFFALGQKVRYGTPFLMPKS